jgi:zinc protease
VERRLAIAEVTRMRDDMYRWPMRLATGAAYGRHPYARTVVGTEASLAVLDAETARAFHRSHVIDGATTIAIVGDVDEEEAATLVAREFPNLRWRDAGDLPRVQWPAQMQFASESRDKNQTALAILFEGAARDDDARFAARLLSAVASGLGGRFFEQLRDRQSLAYTVSAFPVEREAGGAFGAYIATSPAREDEAREGLLAEFRRFLDDVPSAVEVERAQRYLIGTHAISQQSGASVLADIVDAWMFGRLDELNTFVQQVERVTPEAVLNYARRYFDAERRAEGVVRGTRA